MNHEQLKVSLYSTRFKQTISFVFVRRNIFPFGGLDLSIKYILLLKIWHNKCMDLHERYEIEMGKKLDPVSISSYLVVSSSNGRDQLQG